jgi:hypothetical protein
MLGDAEIGIGCPIANLALEMSQVDEGFRRRLDRLYYLWRRSIADLLGRGQEMHKVRRDVAPDSVAGLVVASVAGCRTLAKAARSRHVLSQCVDQLCACLESLRAVP